MDNEKKQVTYNSSITGETQVTFDIQQYMNNRAMFIGLMCNEDGYEEPFGDVTVNLSVAAPNYCGYLNVNDMPDIEKFITDNDIGEFTGFTQRSGFCEYPLYLFNVDKLRELCPDGMDKYEANIGMTRKPETKGVVVYLNQEGRGIGLMEKMKAYKLQEEGMDTVDANICLGHLADERDYGVGAQMLREIGVHKMRLMTNNPVKRVGLEAYGLEITENVAIETTPNPYNERYLRTKKERMGHTLHFNK